MKPEYVGISIAGLLVGYKVCVYCSALYKLKKEKHKKIKLGTLHFLTINV